jgi:hypothetical protein
MASPEVHHTEAPFSVNIRMTKHGETFQFTVRESIAPEFLSALTDLVANLRLNGFEFLATAPAMTRPAVPSTGQGQQHDPSVPAQQGNSLRTEDIIDGYVVGNYTSKRSGALEPCVWLYTNRRPFKAYTVYPEQFASLLPFPVSMDTAGTWSGSPPSKEDARKRGVYVSRQFKLPIVPLTDASGAPVMRGGYMEYRPARPNELPAPSTPSYQGGGDPNADMKFYKQPDAPASEPSAAGPAKFLGFPTITPNTAEYAADALVWSMQKDEDAASVMDLTDEEFAFLSGLRSNVIAHTPVGVAGAKITDKQWELVNSWCAEQVGVQPTATVDVANVGHVPLAGLLAGILCDRFAERPAEFPGSVAVKILRLIMEKRGAEANLEYDAPLTGALSHIFRKEYARLSNGGSITNDLPF